MILRIRMKDLQPSLKEKGNQRRSLTPLLFLKENLLTGLLLALRNIKPGILFLVLSLNGYKNRKDLIGIPSLAKALISNTGGLGMTHYSLLTQKNPATWA